MLDSHLNQPSTSVGEHLVASTSFSIASPSGTLPPCCSKAWASSICALAPLRFIRFSFCCFHSCRWWAAAAARRVSCM